MAEVPPEPSLLGSSYTSKLQEALPRWTAEARTDQRATERSRERSLRQQAADAATFAGALVDLAERGEPVGITTVAGRNVHGTVTTVGLDFVWLQTLWHRDVVIPFGAITVVRPHPGALEAVGDRAPAADIAMVEALAELAVGRPRLVVGLRGPDQTLAGQLRSVGQDVMNLKLDGADNVVASIPLAAVAEVAST